MDSPKPAKPPLRERAVREAMKWRASRGAMSKPQGPPPAIERDMDEVFAEYWRGEKDLLDPVVSPLFGELSGLGPITLFSGTRDVLNPDARLLVEKAANAGVELDFHEGVGQVHVFPLLPTRIGRDARAIIVSRIRNSLSA
jgi:acetyl esterase/lipase